MTFPSPRSLTGGAAAFHSLSGRVPNPQGPPPPLPNGIPFRARDYRAGLGDTEDKSPITPARVLRGGCYLARYTPLQTSPTQPGAVYYLGTLRVQANGPTVTVSGDLYLRRVSNGAQTAAFPEPDPGNGIPVFPRQDYRYYLRATQVSDSPGTQESFTLGLELFRYNAAVAAWANDGPFNALMSWTTTPSGYPSGADYLTGEMKSPAGTVTGTLTIGWVSPFLRAATIEIDRVAGGVAPLSNDAGVGWQRVFDPLGWVVRVIESDRKVPEATGESWADAEMHAAMVKWRDSRENLLDLEWRYHILCVRRIDETERGIMYDASATDSNRAPREGVGIASDWVFDDDPSWGNLKGTRFADNKDTYFRTAVHELGHALGLYHNTADNGFMNTTDVIARRARPERPFPSNIRWQFHPDDEKRLRHMPDAWVRPGGIQFGEDYSVAPIAADDLIEVPEGLSLEVRAVSDILPLGAPARIEFTLRNVSTQPILAPTNLSLRGGPVRGKVVDPAGTVRSFLPLVQCVESQRTAPLAPGRSLSHSATILRGPQGALFPGAGLYRIIIELQWSEGGAHMGLNGTTELLVSAADSPQQAKAAYDILSTPDTLLTIAASSGETAGVKAIEQALSDNQLAPHYAWLEAKRVCKSNDKTKVRDALKKLSTANAVMSTAERQKASQYLDDTAGRSRTRGKASKGKRAADAGAGAFAKVEAELRKQFSRAQ